MSSLLWFSRKELPRETSHSVTGKLQHILEDVPGVPHVSGPLNGGVGLFVSNGKALYRNVRLMPATD